MCRLIAFAILYMPGSYDLYFGTKCYFESYCLHGNFVLNEIKLILMSMYVRKEKDPGGFALPH